MIAALFEVSASGINAKKATKPMMAAKMAMRAAQEHWSEPNDVADADERFRKVKATLAAGGEI